MWKAIFRWIFKHPEVIQGVAKVVKEVVDNKKEAGQEKK
jgi:hypothetical protein